METEKNVPESLQSRLPSWVAIPLFLLISLLLPAIPGAAVILLVPDALHSSNVWIYVLLQTFELLGVLLAAYILLRIDHRPMADLGLSLSGHFKSLIWGMLIAVVIYLIGFGASLMLGGIEVVDVHFSLYAMSSGFLLYIIVAITEEVMVRGYILGRLLQTSLNKFLALFISAAIFAALHLSNPNVTFLSILNILLAGLLLGASYLYTHNLMFPISLHLFWNWIQGTVLGYQVSGQEIGSTLLTLHRPVDSIWNGGKFGFEGSLLCTILAFVATLLIIWWGEKRKAIIV
jgi:membrane protease YdiL (CAAX protease family)